MLVKVGVILLFAILFGLVLAYPLMLLWNYCLVPAIPAIQEVGWAQMWGIQILISVLFKSSIDIK